MSERLLGRHYVQPAGGSLVNQSANPLKLDHALESRDGDFGGPDEGSLKGSALYDSDRYSNSLFATAPTRRRGADSIRRAAHRRRVRKSYRRAKKTCKVNELGGAFNALHEISGVKSSPDTSRCSRGTGNERITQTTQER